MRSRGSQKEVEGGGDELLVSRTPKLKQGSEKKRYMLQPFETCGLFIKIKGNHHLQGNVQVYNVRIPVKAHEIPYWI